MSHMCSNISGELFLASAATADVQVALGNFDCGAQHVRCNVARCACCHSRSADVAAGWGLLGRTPRLEMVGNGHVICAATVGCVEHKNLHALSCAGWALVDSVLRRGPCIGLPTVSPCTAQCFCGGAAIAPLQLSLHALQRHSKETGIAIPRNIPEPSQPTFGADAVQAPLPGRLPREAGCSKRKQAVPQSGFPQPSCLARLWISAMMAMCRPDSSAVVTSFKSNGHHQLRP
jgi:hypothetical protein